MSRLRFVKVRESFEEIYRMQPVSIKELLKKMILDIESIEIIFEKDFQYDLFRKRLLISTVSSYFENIFEKLLEDKYISTNEPAIKLLNKIRRLNMSGFNVFVITSIIEIFDAEKANLMRSTFDKKGGSANQIKKDIQEFNELRNICSHIGDISDSLVSKASIDIIYSYIMEGMILSMAVDFCLHEIKLDKTLTTSMTLFELNLTTV